MRKILIIPDVHGRKFWHKAEEIIDKVDKVVFLGDYLDPYPHEGILVDEAIQEFKQILEFKEKYNDKVVLLTGNHDWHYILKEFSDCSRRSYQHLDDLHELFTNNINKFKLIHLEDNYLFSHAGVYKTWMDKYKFTLENLNINYFIEKEWEPLSEYSYYRGGYLSVGSCLWADIRESLNNELYSDYVQIVGHTQLNEQPYLGHKIKCLDCRKCFILDTNEIDGLSEALPEIFD